MYFGASYDEGWLLADIVNMNSNVGNGGQLGIILDSFLEIVVAV